MHDSHRTRWKELIREFSFSSNMSVRLVILTSIFLAHGLLIFFLMQKHGVHRHLPIKSQTTRTSMAIRLLAEVRTIHPTSDTATDQINAPKLLIMPPFQPLEIEVEVEVEEEKSPIGLIVPQQEQYMTTDQLTEKPEVQIDIDSDVALRLTSNVARAAIVRLQIDEMGDINHVIFEKGDFSDEEIQLLITACKAMKFKAGKIEETPVKSELRIEILIEAFEFFDPFAKPSS